MHHRNGQTPLTSLRGKPAPALDDPAAEQADGSDDAVEGGQPGRQGIQGPFFYRGHGKQPDKVSYPVRQRIPHPKVKQGEPPAQAF